MLSFLTKRRHLTTQFTVGCIFAYLNCSSAVVNFHRRSISKMSIFMQPSDDSSLIGNIKPIVIGLTGSIGMGKSTITQQFMRLGVPVFDADRVVHELYSKGGLAVKPIANLFPDAIVDGSIERSRLSAAIMSDPSVLKAIEAVVHPLVAQKRDEFYQRAIARHDLMIVYDIPLLFENRNAYTLDYVIVVSASAETQRMRVLRRPDMTEEKFEAILAKQIPDATKRELADYVILSDYPSYVEGRAQLAQVIESIVQREQERQLCWQRHRNPHSNTDRAFDAVIFDLDDTLAPVSDPLRLAYAKMKEYMLHSMPQTHAAVMADMAKLMHQ
jgi:dephospho-CoA kinase